MLPLLVAFSITSCRQRPVIDVLEFGLSPRNALRLEVKISARKPAEVFLAFWRDSDTDTLFTPASPTASMHTITAIGMLPETIYHFKAVGRSIDGKAESPVFSITTGKLPESLPEFRLERRDTRFEGFLLGKRYFEQGCFYLLDDSARVIWYEDFGSAAMRAFSLTPDNNILSLQDSSEILEFDWYSNRISGFRIENADRENRYHHALVKTAGGQYLGLNYHYIHPDLQRFGGLPYDTIRTDGLLLADAAGNVLWKWSTFKVADPFRDPELMNNKHDWGHANSIDFDSDGHAVLSYRDFNQVWKVNMTDGSLIWKLGENGDFMLGPDQHFIKQHDAHFDPDGNLILFDNGSPERAITRVISFRIHEKERRVDTNWSFTLDEDLHTRRMGSAQLIDDKRLLICSPRKQLFLAVYTTDGVLLWKAWASHDTLRAIYVPKEALRPPKPF